MSQFESDETYASSDAADYGAEDIKRHFVELSQTETAAEASALAAKLRRAGIIALANAEPRGTTTLSNGFFSESYRTFVMVFASELDRAIEVLNAELGAEGTVSAVDIEDELRAAQEHPETAMEWYHHAGDAVVPKVVDRMLWGLVVLAAGVILYAVS